MRIRLDRTICDGFGVCAARAPGYFSLDDWGYASLAGDGRVAPGDEGAVNRAILDCPVHAVTVLPEPPWSEESRLRRAVRAVRRRPGRDERVDRDRTAPAGDEVDPAVTTDHALLAGRGVAARRPFGPVYADDVRTEIGEDHDAERARPAALQFHDSKPGERPSGRHCHCLLFTSGKEESVRSPYSQERVSICYLLGGDRRSEGGVHAALPLPWGSSRARALEE